MTGTCDDGVDFLPYFYGFFGLLFGVEALPINDCGAVDTHTLIASSEQQQQQQQQQVSRASMTCLLGVVELFVLVKGVGDVLAGRGAGSSRVLLGVKGVGDVLAGRLLRSSSQLSRVSMTCLLGVVELFVLVKGV